MVLIMPLHSKKATKIISGFSASWWRRREYDSGTKTTKNTLYFAYQEYSQLP